MEHLLAVQQRLIPDLIEKMHRRFTILKMIHIHQPIGRRSLSELLHLTERILRTEVEQLKQQHLVEALPKGMIVTSDGEAVLSQLADYMESYNGLASLGSQLKTLYQLKDVIVVKSDARDLSNLETLGRSAAHYLQAQFKPGMTIAVTGGSSTACAAEYLSPVPYKLLFTPARGGLGETVTYQANVIASRMAKKTGGDYEVLYVPDQVSDVTYSSLINEPAVSTVLKHIQSADLIVHGIGDALKMAERRQASNKIKQQLMDNEAVGEAFGYYFDKSGNIVNKVRTIGLKLEDLKEKQIIAIAGGEKKIDSIAAYLKFAPKQTTLITDQVVAEQLLKGQPFDNKL